MAAVRSEVVRWALRKGIEIGSETSFIQQEPTISSKTETKASKSKGNNGKAANKPAKTASGTDRFGTRLGTKFAAANDTLTRKPKAMKRIMEEAGLTATIYNHMNRLTKAGLIRRTDDGYCLKS